MKIDLAHPIIPGRSIGGLEIGHTLPELNNDPINVIALPNCKRFEYPGVHIWIDNRSGAIFQVGAVSGYKGKINERVGIGSTLLDLSKLYSSPVTLDDEGDIVVEGVAGICFSSTEMYSEKPMDNLNAYVTYITGIYIFDRDL